MRNYAHIRQTLEDELALSESLGHPHGLESDCSPKGAAAFLLRQSFFKKLLPSGTLSEDQIEAATKKFLATNDRIGRLVPFEADNEAESCFFDYFVDHLNQCLGVYLLDGFSLEVLGQHMTTGPGSAQKADSRTWVTKVLQSVLTYTDPRLIETYRGALSFSGSWAEAEMRRSQTHGFSKVSGGKMFFVGKNVDEARTCCTEPGLNMLIQQGIRGYLEDRLREYFGIDVEKQPAVNRRLAKQGSLDGSFGTADLTSASDSNSLTLFERVVRPSLLKRLILQSRAKVLTTPGGDTVELNMVSTMGNAFTFPLMTAILASACRASLDLLDPGAEFSVFGDDIVLPKRAYDFTLRMIEKLGYEVNRRKSFNSGPFRESCGHDYFCGRFVRGVYIVTLETPSSVYSAFNRLARWSAYHGIDLSRTLRLLQSMAPGNLVPLEESDDAGFIVPFKLTKPKLDSRYWFKYRAYVKRVRKMTVLYRDDGHHDLEVLVGALHGVYANTWLDLPEDSDSLKGFNRTPGALKVPIREEESVKAKYKIAKRSVPNWNYVPPDSEPGYAWLPGKLPKMLTKFDFDPLRAHQRELFHVWQDVVVSAFR